MSNQLLVIGRLWLVIRSGQVLPATNHQQPITVVEDR